MQNYQRVAVTGLQAFLLGPVRRDRLKQLAKRNMVQPVVGPLHERPKMWRDLQPGPNFTEVASSDLETSLCQEERPRTRVVRTATALALGGVVLVLGARKGEEDALRDFGIDTGHCRGPMATFAAAEKAIESNLGHAAQTTVPLSAKVGWNFPVIPEGAETTIIPVAFPVDSLPKEKQARLVQEMEVFAVLGLAVMIWMLPFFFINRGLCCRCFQRCLSRHLSCYFCLGLLFVLAAVSFMVAKEPDVNANDLFFKLVEVLEFFSDKLSQILMQVTLVLGILVAVLMRKKIVSLLGYDSQIVRADLKEPWHL
eukprot:s3629_g5.t1